MNTSSCAVGVALAALLAACAPAPTTPARTAAPVGATPPARPPVTLTRAPVTPTKPPLPTRTTAPAPKPAPVAASPVPVAGQTWQVTGVVPGGGQVSRTFKVNRLERRDRNNDALFTTTAGNLVLASKDRLLVLNDLDTNSGKNVLWCAAFKDGNRYWGVLATDRATADEAAALLTLRQLQGGLDRLNSPQDLILALGKNRSYGTCTLARR